MNKVLPLTHEKKEKISVRNTHITQGILRFPANFMTIRYLIFSILSVFLLFSCEKSYTCVCEVTLGSINTTQTSSAVDVSNRKKAETLCESKSNINMIPKTECYLKD